MKKTNILLFIATAIVLCLVWACKEESTGIKATYRQLTAAVYSTATVQPQESYTVYAPMAGILQDLPLEEGQQVKRGQLLLRVSSPTADINEANARISYEIARDTYAGDAALLKEMEQGIQSARIKLANDSINYQRQNRLWAQNIGTQQALDASRLAFELQRNELARQLNNYARTRSELARKARQAENSLAMSTLNKGELVVNSLQDGTIYELYKRAGEAVNPQTPIALLGSTSDFVLVLRIDEVDISRVFVGQKAVVALDAYADSTFTATISRIYPTKDERSQTFTVEATFDKAPERLFKGLSGEANIIIAEKKRALTLPRKYLDAEGRVNTPDGLKTVKIGMADLQYVEILGGIDTSTVIIDHQ